ncbi:MAG TPA: beta-ketoacyl synthase N-terminal-like domain-containing protein [Chloroflexota bacterium]|nr:beta-ketoacyl synthase N-terminal-like domain-containing protein [Chloroflexota bacterium]
MESPASLGSEVAIIGMAGRFPGAADVEAFWENLRNGVESIASFSDEELEAEGVEPELIRDPRYVKRGGVLDDIASFDASFFGYSPREAELIDPQQRLFLECAWEAMESAGRPPCAPAQSPSARVGVFAGTSTNTYLLFNLLRAGEALPTDVYPLLIGNEKDFLSTRVSYKLNLTGPSMTIQTACSTSLVAVHLACQSLLNGECDMALAGGVTLRVPHRAGYLFQEGGILSPDGRCRAFDAEARGTVGGNGVGVVLLKRLSEALRDRDTVRAVIRGTAINNDGAVKVGFTAPSVEGQSAVIAEALAVAGVEPATIGYVEAHGTGTPLGDPIEVAALGQVFGQRPPGAPHCAIGAVKTNIGHLDAAAGVAGLIKTTLALEHGMLPPSLNFRRPNPQAGLAGGPFSVNAELTPWRSEGPRRAGLSSFGIGGTNAHAVLEEAPPAGAADPGRPRQLLVLSARGAAGLDAALARLAAHLERNPKLSPADVAYTLQVGRRHFPHRAVLVVQDAEDARAALAAGDPRRVRRGVAAASPRPVVFMFPGQGAQHTGMGRELYEHEPTFRAQVDRCAELLRPHLGLDLRQVLYPSPEQEAEAARRLDETWLTQPALFVVEHALARLWMEWGLRPQAMIGHSVGEYVAACLAGVFSLEDGLELIAARGRLMHELPGGAMLAVPLSEEEVRRLLGEELALAAINGPASCVVAGPNGAVEELERRLAERGVPGRRLSTSHAFHSPMMEPVVGPFVARIARVDLRPPRIPYVSNVSGRWIAAEEATDPGYWGRHARQAVRFADGIGELFGDADRLLLEVGPGRTLSGLARRSGTDRIALASLPHPRDQQSDLASLFQALGELWLAGVDVDWVGRHADEPRRRVPLPTYPFERQRYWIEPRRSADQPGTNGRALRNGNGRVPVEEAKPPTLHERPDVATAYAAPRGETARGVADVWQRLLGIERVGVHDNFFELGGDSLLAIQLLARLRERFAVELPLEKVVEAPTVAGLAALIDGRRRVPGAAASRSPLVAIQAGGSRRPFFCIHPAGGTVLCYAELARHLGPDQPFFGLQSPGVYGQPELESIEETAASYLPVVRAVQPEGPYRLGGLSYGGNVAFEMARQLQEQGQPVELLALFDSHPPVSYHHASPDDTEFLAAFPWVLGLLSGKELKVAPERLRQLGPEEQVAYVLERAKRAGLVPPQLTAAEASDLFGVWKSHHHALRCYAPPPGGYRQEITLFRAKEGQPAELLELLRIGLTEGIERTGWEMLTRERLAIVDVPGNHYTMLNPPNVEILASALAERLDAAAAARLR